MEAGVGIELDGFVHGTSVQFERDLTREELLTSEDIEVLRFWNRQWRSNREGVLLEIWHALHRRTGCTAIVRKAQNHRCVPPDPRRLTEKPAKPPISYPWKCGH